MLVNTISGNRVERSLCIKINNEFYEKNVDCVSIDNRWYRKTNIKVYFDHGTQSYELRNGSEVRGIIHYYEDNMSFSFGEFKLNLLSKSSYIQVSNSEGFYVVNDFVFSAIPKVLTRDGNYLFIKYAMRERFFDQYKRA